jgi:crossover junction endodeoxyribonuclease RuvC
MPIILGLDPGIARTGFGVVASDVDSIRHLRHGCITTPKESAGSDRLVMIVDQVGKLIEEVKPDMIAIEELFFASNVTTGISVAQARGAMIATAARFQIPITSYTPLEVKQAITGYGRADKRQMQKMITMVLGLPAIPTPDDAADALAVAVTHAHSYKILNALNQ